MHPELPSFALFSGLLPFLVAWVTSLRAALLWLARLARVSSGGGDGEQGKAPSPSVPTVRLAHCLEGRRGELQAPRAVNCCSPQPSVPAGGDGNGAQHSWSCEGMGPLSSPSPVFVESCEACPAAGKQLEMRGFWGSRRESSVVGECLARGCCGKVEGRC